MGIVFKYYTELKIYAFQNSGDRGFKTVNFNSTDKYIHLLSRLYYAYKFSIPNNFTQVICALPQRYIMFYY